MKAGLRSSLVAWERIRCAPSVLGRWSWSEKASDVTAHLSLLHIMLVAGGRTVSVGIVLLARKCLQVSPSLVFASNLSSDSRAGPFRTRSNLTQSPVRVGKSAAPAQPCVIVPQDGRASDMAGQEPRFVH